MLGRFSMIFDTELKCFSEKVQQRKHANSIVNYSVSVRSGKTKNKTLSLKTFLKKASNKFAAKSSSLGSKFDPKLLLWVSQASQSLPGQPPGSPKASPGSLCDFCLGAPSFPCEPLTPSWHCLDASKSYFGCLSTLNISFVEVLGPKILTQNWRFVSQVSKID